MLEVAELRRAVHQPHLRETVQQRRHSILIFDAPRSAPRRGMSELQYWT